MAASSHVSRRRKRACLYAAGLALCALQFAALSPNPAFADAAPAEVAALAGQHPAAYIQQASRMFEAGRKDEAVFVYYLGQIRYRALLAARPDLKPQGDPALFASLREVVGRPINEYAAGDIPRLAQTLDAVLAYDAAHPDRFTPPEQFPQIYAKVRAGLMKEKAYLIEHADSIRAIRAQNGLPNRN